MMLPPIDDILWRQQRAIRQFEELERATSDWRDRWYQRRPEDATALVREDVERSKHRQPLIGKIEHLQVLGDIVNFDPANSQYEPGCVPAFAMSHDVLSERLAQWLLDVIQNDGNFSWAPDSHRLLLGWCAQVLLIPALVAPKPRMYPSAFMEAACSLYGYAVGDGALEEAYS